MSDVAAHMLAMGERFTIVIIVTIHNHYDFPAFPNGQYRCQIKKWSDFPYANVIQWISVHLQEATFQITDYSLTLQKVPKHKTSVSSSLVWIYLFFLSRCRCINSRINPTKDGSVKAQPLKVQELFKSKDIDPSCFHGIHQLLLQQF